MEGRGRTSEGEELRRGAGGGREAGFHTKGGGGISPPNESSPPPPRILKVYVQFYMALYFSWSFD